MPGFKIIPVLLLLFIGFPGNGNSSFANDKTTAVHQSYSENTSIDNNVEQQTETRESEDEDHESGINALFFIIMALIISAATRHFLKKLPFPFTVLLMIFGLLLGIFGRLGMLGSWDIGSFQIDLSLIDESLEWAAHINPHLLLFIFLPILIFEAAFAMDVHIFKKTVANATILAVPGIIVSLVITGLIVYAIDYYGIGLNGWANWSIAFMFGAVISATDPVAVVALLKDLGASKKLGTLIEGESMLNDGTSIVLFMVFLMPLIGEESGTSPLLDFCRVSFGGILVGLLVGWISLKWIKGVVNDPLVENSIVVAAAYLTFYVAEHFLHVSGVLALVTLGLIVGGIGRTRISPQVQHFMHEFWEMAGFLANSLIFIIVGVVIAKRSTFEMNDFIVLGLVYIGIHVARGVTMFVLYPFMRKTGYGLSTKFALVAWYGALRGAVGLALALIVAGVDDKFIPAAIKEKFLFLTAGIVLLTLLINATTIKAFLRVLGMSKLPPAKVNMIVNANQYLIQSAENHLQRIKSDRYLKLAKWDKVKEYMPGTSEERIMDETELEAIAEIRRRILESEKSNYWHQFKDGLIGPNAYRHLSEGINEVMDANGLIPLSERKDFDDQWETPALLEKLQKTPLLGNLAKKWFLGRLTVSYDCAVGFIESQKECLKLVESMYRGGEPEDILKKMEEELNENIIHGQTFIRNLRHNFHDVYTAISTRQAIRNLLHYELKTVNRLQKKGRIDSEEAGKMIAAIEQRTKRLINSPPEVEML